MKELQQGRASKEVASKSALNPVQWICAITVPSAATAAYFIDDPVRYVFVGLAVLTVGYAIRAYEFLLQNDRDRLHSEKYLIERQVVAQLGVNKGDGSADVIEIEPRNLTENPVRQVTDTKKEKGQ